MELIYLRVKGYKNIQNQGFNFSPRFKCDYKDGKLTLIDKDKTGESYTKNFFDKKGNINITAIVGENGSGKSSILKSILKLEDFHCKYVLVYKENDNIYYSSDIDDIDIKCNRHIPLISNTYLSNTIVLDNFLHDYHKAYGLIDISMKSIISTLISNEVKNRKFEISSFMYIPTTIKIKYKEADKLINQYTAYAPAKSTKEVKDEFERIGERSYHQFLMIEYLRIKSTDHKHFDIEIYKDLLKLKKCFESNESSLSTRHEAFIKLSNEKTLDILKDKKEIEYYTNKPYFDYFEYDLIDSKGLRYNDFSHGEQMIFGQLLKIYLNTESEKNLLFLFDEPEISLHPKWQKEYLNEVITLLKKMGKKYHFIFTTHSPFLLSDLPKENVIFLKKDKETGKCINVTKTTDINPFGANIHTLLSHGFFMEGGLMGEFAKGKIDDVIKLLNSPVKLTNDEIQDCENIISIIGEPIIKNQLRRMLDSKRLKKIDNINKKIEEMEYELKILKENQNRYVKDELNNKAKKNYYTKKNTNE